MQSEDIFSRIKKIRVSDTVVDQVVSLIRNGTLRIGDQLPSERELVNQFQVARASVREALRVLEFQGVIEVQPGKGAFIVDDGQAQISEETTIRSWFAANASENIETMQVLAIIEQQSLLMAGSAGPEALTDLVGNLRATLKRARAAVEAGDMEELILSDRQFHHLLGTAGGNRVLAQMNDLLLESLVSPKRSILRLPAQGQRSLREHEAVIAALETGDTTGAGEAIVDHFEHLQQSIREITVDNIPASVVPEAVGADASANQRSP